MYRSNYPDAPGMHRVGSQRLNRRAPSILKQLKESFIPVVFGLALFCCGIGLIFWNEGRAVQRARSLDEAIQSVRSLETLEVVFDENNGKLIHVSGPLLIEDQLSEEEYGISVPAVKLKRRVQMYQWIEEASVREDPGVDHPHSETSYSYHKDWRDKLISSLSFDTSMGHDNPQEFPLATTVYVNSRVKVAKFLLGTALKELFTNFVLFTSDERPDNPSIKMHADLYYHTHDVYNPEIGDIRIQFTYAGLAGDMVTIIAMQAGRELRPYKTSTGDEILLLRQGVHMPEVIFSEEHAQNWFFLWLLRVSGWFLMFLGCVCLSNILHLLVAKFPLIYDLVALGVTSLNFTISMSMSLLIIACGWLWYRPFLGGALLLAAAAPFIYASLKMYQRDRYENINRYRRRI